MQLVNTQSNAFTISETNSDAWHRHAVSRKVRKNHFYFIVNNRYGELISSSFAESAINEVVSKRMVKKQQMRWTKEGAHMLLQVRVKTLNNELRSKYEEWYPALRHHSGATEPAIAGANANLQHTV